MTDAIIAKVFEHNNWANAQMIAACSFLSDDQLDAVPHSATKGTIRQTLVHLATKQRDYLSLLTLPIEARPTSPITIAELRDALHKCGEALLQLVRGEPDSLPETPVRTTDGYDVEPWVVLVQVINHATEHREQINSMLTSLGVAPPDLDGWSFGEVSGALVPVSPRSN